MGGGVSFSSGESNLTGIAASLRAAAFALAGLLVVGVADAFVTGGAWPTGTITLTLQMTAARNPPPAPAGGISDGSADWNAVVASAADAWSGHLNRCQLVANASSSTTVGQDNDANNLFFDDNYYGTDFGTRTLAVTLTNTRGNRGLRTVESDIVFNSDWTWDSYRGGARPNTVDLRRVAIHEIGHVLGLGHPDQDTPAQIVAAIMNSTVGNIETPTADDIAGAEVLYGSPTAVPAITRQPRNQTVSVGGTAEMSVELNGGTAPAPSEVLAYSWFFTPSGRTEEFLFTFPDGRIPLGAAQLEDEGSYHVVVETPDGEVTSSSAALTVNGTAITPSTRLGNISTRGYAGSGEESLIAGFVVSGSGTRRVLIRAVGPALRNAPFNVANALDDPRLEVFQSQTSIAANDDWGEDNAAELNQAFAQSGAFALPDGSSDAAIIVEVPAGLYTAIASRNSGGGRIALVEVYDLGGGDAQSARLSNLSTRGWVGTGDELLIAGLIVTGPGPRTFLLRAAGDSLENMGINGFLDDTVIRLFTGQTELRWTDDWDSPGFLQPILADTFTATGAFSFVDRQESALRVTLNPGSYTLQVSGFADATGVALVEIYEVP